MKIKITSKIYISESELKFTFIRSSGPGGQNVNKVATAAELRFQVAQSPSLPDDVRERLLVQIGNKINLQGELVIKSNRFRTQERNKHDAINRLKELIARVATPPKPRKKTKPSMGAKERRLSNKKHHAKIKSLRQKEKNGQAFT